jgi:hypothetical protein
MALCWWLWWKTDDRGVAVVWLCCLCGGFHSTRNSRWRLPRLWQTVDRQHHGLSAAGWCTTSTRPAIDQRPTWCSR